jgi:hypothetical protein
MLWDGRYEVGKALGGGGCHVHRAIDTRTQTPVILKYTRAEMLHSDSAFREWACDARVRAKHRTRFLPRMLRAAFSPVPYSVSEEVPGPTLAGIVRAKPSDAAWAQLIVSMRGMGESLAAAGIAPDDWDPSNVVFRDGDPAKPVYVDCGRVCESLPGEASERVYGLLYAAMTGHEATGRWRERWRSLGVDVPRLEPVSFWRPDLPLASQAMEALTPVVENVETCDVDLAIDWEALVSAGGEQRLNASLLEGDVLAEGLASRGFEVWRLSPRARVSMSGFSHVERLDLPLSGPNKLERSLEAYALSGTPLCVMVHDDPDDETVTAITRVKNRLPRALVLRVSSAE